MNRVDGRGFAEHRRDWEDIGELDPFWAVLSSRDRRDGRWELDEFFATGEVEVAELMRLAAELGVPTSRTRALDFGCGVGRLTRALGARFEEASGVDVSEPMIRRARELDASRGACVFTVNRDPDLRRFGDQHFDLVYSRIVLQHLPNQRLIAAYLAELARVLAPGGLLACQLLTDIPPARRLQVRRRAYRVLRRLGAPATLLHTRLRLMSYGVTAMPQTQAIEVLRASGAEVLRIVPEELHSGILSATFYATRPTRLEESFP